MPVRKRNSAEARRMERTQHPLVSSTVRHVVVCGRSFVPLYWVYTAIRDREEKYINHGRATVKSFEEKISLSVSLFTGEAARLDLPVETWKFLAFWFFFFLFELEVFLSGFRWEIVVVFEIRKKRKLRIEFFDRGWRIFVTDIWIFENRIWFWNKGGERKEKFRIFWTRGVVFSRGYSLFPWFI